MQMYARRLPLHRGSMRAAIKRNYISGHLLLDDDITYFTIHIVYYTTISIRRYDSTEFTFAENMK